jgi:hypothetical protein
MIIPNQPIVCVDSTLSTKDLVPADWNSETNYYQGGITVTLGVGVTVSGPTKGTVDFRNQGNDCKNAILRIHVSGINLPEECSIILNGLSDISITTTGWWQIPITTAEFSFTFDCPDASIDIDDMHIYCFDVDEPQCDNCKTGEYSQPILISFFSSSSYNTESLSVQAEAIFCDESIAPNFCVGEDWTLSVSEPYEDETDWIALGGTPPNCYLTVSGGCDPAATSAWSASAEASINLVEEAAYKIVLTLEEFDDEFCGNVDILVDGVAVEQGTDLACPGEYILYFTWTGATGSYPFEINVDAQLVDGKYKAKLRVASVAIYESFGFSVTLLPSDSLTSVDYANSAKTTYVFTGFYGGIYSYAFSFGSDSRASYSEYDCFRLAITQNQGCDEEMQYCVTETYKWITDPCNTIRVLASQDVTDTKGACAFGFTYPSNDAFNDGFFHRTRIYGELRNPQYDGEVVSYQDSAGRKRVVYAESREFVELAVNLSPRYVHNFMRLACRHDIFNMNDLILPAADYFTRSEAYSPTWVRTRSVAPAFLEVEVKEQNLRKDPCCDGLPVNPEDCETTCEPCPEIG